MFQLCEKIFVRSVVLLVLAFISLSSYAVISVLPIMKQIKFTDPKFFDFKVINLSKDEPAYVEVTAYKATNVSSGAIKWVAMKHNPRQFGFVVTPTKLIVPALQMCILQNKIHMNLHAAIVCWVSLVQKRSNHLNNYPLHFLVNFSLPIVICRAIFSFVVSDHIYST